MINLIIISTGAVAAEVTAYIETGVYKWEGDEITIKGYLEYEEYSYLHNKYKYRSPILGTIDNYPIQKEDYFIVANSDSNLRKEFSEKMLNKGAKFINLIHPSCIIAPTSVIGIGNILSPHCQIGPIAKLGDFNILTTGTLVSHDCVIGNFNSFSSVSVCGHVIIGNSNTFYIRSAIIPHITIGNNCIIQAGMIVDKNVPNDTTVFYKYKERILAIPQ